MDLKRLNHFIVLAEERRFAAAAARVHLSQAAFSRSIQTLEARLGVQLFDRSPQSVSLTPMGEALLKRARDIVFDSSCLLRDIELMSSADAGELVLGVAPVPGVALLPGLLSQLRREHPGLVVRLRMGNLPQLLEQLNEQTLDFCLGDPRLVPADPRRSSKFIARVPAGLYCRAGHPLLRRRRLDAPQVMREFGVGCISISPVLLGKLARSLGFESIEQFPLALECDDIRLLMQAVSESDLIGVLPLGTAAGPGQALRALPWTQNPVFFADVHALWLTGRTLSPAAELALAALQALGLERYSQRAETSDAAPESLGAGKRKRQAP